jgi:hypothetical protein
MPPSSGRGDRTPGKSVTFYQTTRREVPEDRNNVDSRLSENVKSQKMKDATRHYRSKSLS